MVNDMNYKDKLPDLIDGLLPLDEEKAIFAQLAKDEELLFEYKALSSIFTTINSNISQYTPSNQVTDAVFAKIGIQSPTFEHQLTFIDNRRKFNKYSKASLALAASFALFLSISTLNKYSIIPLHISTMQNQIVSKADLMEFAKDNNNKYLKSKSISKSLKSNLPIEIIQTEDKNVIDELDSQIPNKEFTSEFNSSQITEDNSIQLADYQYNIGDKDYESLSFLRQNNNPQSSLSSNDEPSNSNNYLSEIPAAPNSMEFIENYSRLNEELFTIELKNSIYFNTQKSDKPSAKLNNIGLTILYQINDNFSAGVDFRDESFKLQTNEEVETLSSNSSTINSQSNIALTSIGLAVRYNLKEKGDTFYPSGQVILAKNREGVVGRVNFGISFKPIPGLTTTAGIEYSNLTYSSSSISYNSPKLGLNYGLAYNF